VAKQTTNEYTRTIPAGGTISQGDPRLDRLVPVGGVLPPEWETGTFSIQVSLDGTDWLDLPISIGTFDGTADTYVPFDPAYFLGPNYWRIKSNVPQASECELTIIGVDF